MKRGATPVKAINTAMVLFQAVFVGAGAADMTLATDAQFHRELNLGLTCTRTSTGLYVVTLRDSTAFVTQVIPSIVDTAGEGLRATVKTDVATSSGVTTLTINVWDPAGSLDDVETTGTLMLLLVGYDTTV